MLLFTNNAFVPGTVLTCDVTVHVLEKEKKNGENTNVGLEMWIQTHT